MCATVPSKIDTFQNSRTGSPTCYLRKNDSSRRWMGWTKAEPFEFGGSSCNLAMTNTIFCRKLAKVHSCPDSSHQSDNLHLVISSLLNVHFPCTVLKPYALKRSGERKTNSTAKIIDSERWRYWYSCFETVFLGPAPRHTTRIFD